MSRIAIGQHYPADSPIHRLDPRVKLICVIGFITTLLFVTNFYALGAAAFFIILIVKAAKIPLRYLLRGLRMIFFVMLFAVAINIFLTPGENILFEIGFVRVTSEGLARAALMGSRIILLVTGSTMLTLTTSPIKLTDGIESLLRPTPLPAHDIALMMTIALRMIPTLAQETEKIMKAQKARGASFSGSFVKKVRAFVPILVPLFVSAFKRADELATAMEARCYNGGKNRTKLHPLQMRRTDWLALLLCAAICAGLIVLPMIFPMAFPT
jgi:energy-coupling factor transport system permease protein